VRVPLGTNPLAKRRCRLHARVIKGFSERRDAASHYCVRRVETDGAFVTPADAGDAL
jgi:hypothetical protein